MVAVPQEFETEQEEPYPIGVAGAETLQMPLEFNVPVLDCPQAFATVQATGAEAEQDA